MNRSRTTPKLKYHLFLNIFPVTKSLLVFPFKASRRLKNTNNVRTPRRRRHFELWFLCPPPPLSLSALHQYYIPARPEEGFFGNRRNPKHTLATKQQKAPNYFLMWRLRTEATELGELLGGGGGGDEKNTKREQLKNKKSLDNETHRTPDIYRTVSEN